MNENMLYGTLKKLCDQQHKQDRLPAMDHYLDEQTGQVKSISLTFDPIFEV